MAHSFSHHHQPLICSFCWFHSFAGHLFAQQVPHTYLSGMGRLFPPLPLWLGVMSLQLIWGHVSLGSHICMGFGLSPLVRGPPFKFISPFGVSSTSSHATVHGRFPLQSHGLRVAPPPWGFPPGRSPFFFLSHWGLTLGAPHCTTTFSPYELSRLPSHLNSRRFTGSALPDCLASPYLLATVASPSRAGAP